MSSPLSPNTDPHPRRVLLVIDCQICMFEPPDKGVPAGSVLKHNIHRVLTCARDSAHPPIIIHVRNMGDAGEPDELNAPGWHLVFPPLPHEHVVNKFKNNAFAGTNLGDLIPTDAEIVVVGLQSDFCIRATCSAALGRGNEVLLIRGAHATYDRVEVFVGPAGATSSTPAAVVEKEIEDELEEAGVVLLDMRDLDYIFMNR